MWQDPEALLPGWHWGRRSGVWHSTGSTWFKDSLVASVEKVRSHPQVQRGALDHSWIDIAAIAKLSGKVEKDLVEAWDKIVQG